MCSRLINRCACGLLSIGRRVLSIGCGIFLKINFVSRVGNEGESAGGVDSVNSECFCPCLYQDDAFIKHDTVTNIKR